MPGPRGDMDNWSDKKLPYTRGDWIDHVLRKIEEAQSGLTNLPLDNRCPGHDEDSAIVRAKAHLMNAVTLLRQAREHV